MGGVPSACPKMSELKTLGILAGSGDLPRQVASAASQSGAKVYVLDLDSSEEPWDASYTVLKCGLGKVGKALSFFRSHDVKDLVFAGKIERPRASELAPDFKGMAWMAQLLPIMGQDDQVLRKLISLFEGEGFTFHSAGQFIKQERLCSAEGSLPETYGADLALGRAVLDTLSPYNVGQAIVVCDGQVIGIEGAEGTDGLLQRSCDLIQGRDKKALFIKMPKSTQDTRVDEPVVGTRTLKFLNPEVFAGVALHREGVVVLDPEVFQEQLAKTGQFLHFFE